MNFYPLKNKSLTVLLAAGLFVVLGIYFTAGLVWAAPNLQINYQGKLTNASNVAVADAGYQMEFSLYTASSGGTAIWTETRTGVSEVTVQNGLFSVMLGSVNSLSGVDFNQTLYLGVTVEADAEMTPRKVLGAVPAAFEANNANTVGGVASTSILRNDRVGTISTTSASTLLTIIQSGTGDILNLFDDGTEVFSVLDGGNVGIGSTSPSAKLTVSGNTFIGGNLTATGTMTISGTSTLASTTISSLAIGSLSGLLFGTSGNVTAVATSTLGIALSDTTGILAATRGGTGFSTITQNQLLIGGAGNTWNQVATSSLGLSVAFGTSFELATIISNETGSGALVFATAPTFSGTVVFPSSIQMSGTFFARSGNHNLTLTTTATTIVTLPTSGTLYGTAASSFSSANLLGSLSDKTGTGTAVFSIAPTFTGLTSFASTTNSANLTVNGTSTLATTTISSSTIDTLTLNNALATTNGGTGATTSAGARTNLGATTVGSNIFTLTNPGTLSFLRINADNTVSAVATSTLGIALSDTTGTLTVNRGGTGAVTLTGLLQGNGTGAVTAVTGTAGQFAYYNGASTLAATSSIFLATNGNFGVGTTTPGDKLTVAGGINIGGGSSGLSINGVRILYASSTNNSTLVGEGAGANLNGSGVSNTAVGYRALQTATSSTQNTAIGYEALTNNTSALYNTAVGYSALISNTIGDANSAFGVNSLRLNINGYYNTAFGNSSLYSNTSGQSNTAVGQGTLGLNTIGSLNVAIGADALNSNSSGTRNTAIGVSAGADLINAQFDGRNTLIGYDTGRGITTGINNTIIGANVTGLSATLANNIILADGQGNQRINVGSTGNVGIGSTSPSAKLTVGGAGYFGGNLTATGTLAISGTSTFAGNMLLVGTTANIALGTNYLSGDGDDEGVFVTSSGDVGIGTSTPLAKLTVIGNVNSTAEFASTNAVSFRSMQGNYGSLLGSDGTNFYLLFTNSGDQYGGFNTLRPFTVNVSTGVVSMDNSLSMTGVSSNISLGSNYLSGDGDDEGIYVSGVGNVGIGSTSPSSKLTVAGNGLFGGSLTATGTLAISGTSTLATTTITDLALAGAFRDTTSSAGTNGMVLLSTGTSTRWTATSSLGLGGGSSLFTDGGATTYLTSLGDNLAIGSTSANSKLDVWGNFQVGTSSTPNLFVNTASNFVGIGTTTKLGTAVLNVNGNTNFNDGMLSGDGGNFGLRFIGGVVNVRGQSGGEAITYFNNSITGNGDGYALNFSSGDVNTGRLSVINVGDANNSYISFQNKQSSVLTESLRINANGNLSIGTTASSSRLTVGGTFLTTGTSTLATTTITDLALAGAFRDTTSSAGTNGMVLLSTGTSTRWTATSSLGLGGGSSLFTDGGATTYLTSLTDNLGLGTTTANQALTIFRDGADAAIEFSTVSGSLEKWTIGIDDSDEAKFKISSSSALGTNDRFVIDSSGRVGIGTSSPAELLHVQSNGNLEAEIRVENNVSGTLAAAFFGAKAVGSTLGAQFGMGSAGLTFSSGALADRAYVYAPSDTSGINIYADGADPIIFTINSTEAGRFGTTGNFGLGTTTPNSKLTVVGDSLITGTSTLATTTITNLALVQALAGTSGGTGFNTYSTGDFIYASGVNTLAKRTIGSTGDVLSVVSGVPTWVATSTLGFGGGSSLFTDGGATSYLTSLTDNLAIGSTSAGTNRLSVAGEINIDSGSSGLSILGNRVLYASSTNESTAVGFDAGGLLNSGSTQSTALGFAALASATSSVSNTAIGYAALNANVGGQYNTAVGASALISNTIGDANSAFGVNALRLNTEGYFNTAFGNATLYSNTSGAVNTAIGYGTMGSNTIGDNNVAIGADALNNNASGTRNTAIGVGAGFDLINDQFDGRNTLIGFEAGKGITTGINNTIIGANVTGLAATLSNNIILADGQGNQRINVGSTGNVGIGSTSPSAKLTVAGTFLATGTSTLATTTITDLALAGAFRDTTNSAGTIGMVLQTTGTSTRWVATSTLGIAGGASTFLALTDTPSAYTANRVMFTNSGATALTDSANFTFDGARLSTLNLNVTGTSTFVGTTTLATTTINGLLQMGTTSVASRFNLDVNNYTAAGTAGLNRYYTSTNAASGTVQFGELAYSRLNTTATTTYVGSMFRVEDSTTRGNTVRGLEVQTNRGTNTQGENTALAGFARTFGVRGFTNADAGGVFEPAGGYFETGGTTQGNAIRGYSSTITSAGLLSLFQDTSTFTGTGLTMNLGNGSGSFTGKFVDLQVAGSSKFNVASTGTMFTLGDISVTATNTDPAANNVVGIYLGASGFASINRSANPAMNLGRSNDGAVLQFYSAGAVQGSVSIAGATVSYNAFTGSHFGITGSTTYPIGTLMQLSGDNASYNDDPASEILYGMEATTEENSSLVIGSYLSVLEPAVAESIANPTLVMAVGNGAMWVADQGDDINRGDYLISSNVAGHAELDPQSDSQSYIIARASEDINWNEVTTEINGVKHKLVTVFFENFVRSNIDLALIASSTVELEDIDEESQTGQFMSGLFAKLTSWFGSAQNGIEDMYANVFNANERICVDGECLTADDIRDLKDALQGGGSNNPPPATPPPSEGGSGPTDSGGDSGSSTGGGDEGEGGSGDSGSGSGGEEVPPPSDEGGSGGEGGQAPPPPSDEGGDGTPTGGSEGSEGGI